MYTRVSDGGVSIIIPNTKEAVEKDLRRQLSDAEFEQHVRDVSIPMDAINVAEVEDINIPSDREFRNAWKQNGGAIDIDLAEAKNIQLDRIRKAREPKLIDLDKEFMLALEKGLDTTIIAAKKQELRDITEPLKNLNPTNIQEIKDAFPQELK